MALSPQLNSCCCLHFQPLLKCKKSPLVFSLHEILVAVFCVSTARVQTTAGRTGSPWERKNHFDRTVAQRSKLLLHLTALWPFTAINVSVAHNFNLMLRGQHPSSTGWKSILNEEKILYSYFIVPVSVLQAFRASSSGFGKATQKKKKVYKCCSLG